MNINQILVTQNQTELVDKIYKLYKQSFPKHERIDVNEFFCKNQSLFAFFDDNEFIGFILCSKEINFTFISYFAVEQTKRNCGYGSAILNEFKKHNASIVLNIEYDLKVDKLAYKKIQRLMFYKKNGFVQAEMIFDWEGEILSTLYFGNLNYEEYKVVLLKLFPTCKNFRKQDIESIKLIPIHKSSLYRFYESYKKDFAYNERRSKKEYLELLTTEKRFNSYYFFTNGVLIGYINYWDFNKFIFVEHFAIFEKYRHLGYGNKCLKHFLTQIKKNVIIEIEPPLNLIANNRKNFYEKLNFKMSDIEYYQPSYHKKGKIDLRLNIMHYGDITEKELKEFIYLIRKSVYKTY